MTKALIVDDEPDIREVLTRLLERESLNVRVADSGAEGLRKFREDPADIVITDIIMPDVDGIQFIKSLRSEFPRARIIAISGGGNMGPLGYRPEAITTTAYLVAAEQAGADCIITKPFDREELMGKIRELCSA
jgi:DNA-binding response OmpR family regulator